MYIFSQKEYSFFLWVVVGGCTFLQTYSLSWLDYSKIGFALVQNCIACHCLLCYNVNRVKNCVKYCRGLLLNFSFFCRTLLQFLLEKRTDPLFGGTCRNFFKFWKRKFNHLLWRFDSYHRYSRYFYFQPRCQVLLDIDRFMDMVRSLLVMLVSLVI